MSRPFEEKTIKVWCQRPIDIAGKYDKYKYCGLNCPGKDWLDKCTYFNTDLKTKGKYQLRCEGCLMYSIEELIQK